MKLLITGGSSEIAKEIILSQVHKKFEIHITSSSQKSLEDSIKTFKLHQIPVKGFVYNFQTPDLKNINFSYDALILNAASVQERVAPIHTLEDSTIKTTLDDIWGNIKVIKNCLPSMIEKKFGRIVFISSLSTQLGTSSYAPYIAAKSALEGVIKNLAVDYSQFNILSNTLRLGLFKTSRNRVLWKRQFYQEKINDNILQSRMGVPQDIIEPILFLLSQDLYCTGNTINLGGGLPLINSSKY